MALREVTVSGHPSERSIAFEMTTTIYIYIYVIRNRNTFICARTGDMHGNYGGSHNLP